MKNFSVEEYFSVLEKFEWDRAGHLRDLRSIRQKIARCPASTKYHGSNPGGLINHLMSVRIIAMNLCSQMAVNIDNLLNFESSLEFCALVHDLGKIGTPEQDFYLINPDESMREKEPFIVNTQLVSMPHELRTLYWLNTLGVTDLTDDEYQALYFHAGPYTEGYLTAVRKESPLLVLLHTADNLSTKLIEVNK